MISAAIVLVVAAPGASARPAPIHVDGNRLANASGATVRVIGVNRSGSEYACAGPVAGGGYGWGFWQGPVDDRAVEAMRTWRVRAVALPLNEACWLGGYGGLNPAYTGKRYRDAVARYVGRLEEHGIRVVLRLSGAAPGKHVYGKDPEISASEIPMADADHSLAFWRSVARRFKHDRALLFHAFDEPNGIGWGCALNGCVVADRPEGRKRYGTYRAVGHQSIVDAIRSTGAKQPIVVSGIDFAGNLSRWRRYRPHDPLGQLVAGLSAFDYSGNYPAVKPDLERIAKRHPILVGGFGDTDCDSDFSRGLMRFADSLGVSYLAWTWNSVQDYGGCSNALLDGGDPSRPDRGYYTARPSGYGKGVRAHLRSLP
ncbi:MAG TPA: cellulase family glycosylhydrolase [Thermoleophilaceae bacterium]|nr:cellulase family glycosylhydrolase [Thermoleophilaceae bacterium]